MCHLRRFRLREGTRAKSSCSKKNPQWPHRPNSWDKLAIKCLQPGTSRSTFGAKLRLRALPQRRNVACSEAHLPAILKADAHGRWETPYIGTAALDARLYDEGICDPYPTGNTPGPAAVGQRFAAARGDVGCHHNRACRSESSGNRHQRICWTPCVWQTHWIETRCLRPAHPSRPTANCPGQSRHPRIQTTTPRGRCHSRCTILLPKSFGRCPPKTLRSKPHRPVTTPRQNPIPTRVLQD